MMKRIRINLGKVGIVTRNGDYNRVLNAGTYWVRFSENVTLYDMSKLYSSAMDLNIMLKDDTFRNITELIEVKDNEIALMFNGKNFEKVLASGRYFYFKGIMDYSFKLVDLTLIDDMQEISRTLLQRSEFSNYIQKVNIESFEEGLLLIDGKFVRKLAKGNYFFWKSSVIAEVLKVDMRQLQLEVSGQEILTRDKAALRLNFHVLYNVIDAEKALMDCKDYEKQLYMLVQMALREYVGTMLLDELLDNKETVSTFILKALKVKATKLGIEIYDAGIKDIILPGEMKEIMNQVLIAQKQAQANTIMRREETASTRSLLNTAKLLEENAMLFKLKEMEYVEKIAGKIGEITVSGNGQVIDQLRGIFSSK